MDPDVGQHVRLGSTATGIAAGSSPDTVVVTLTSGVLLYSLAKKVNMQFDPFIFKLRFLHLWP